MITGFLALIFLIPVIVGASNGEWGVVAIFAVLIVLVLAFGVASREQDRAYNNFVDYWANRSKRDVRKEENIKRIRKREEAQKRWREEDKKPPDESKVLCVETAGNMMSNQGTTMKCTWCGADMQELNRIRYSSGAVFVTYHCPKCKKHIPVRM